ncbi:MAG: acetoin dehydrogenase [Nitrospirae bacterium GWF2_44_13]|nr:MAG: acetoin dehydrogenase [Nitrospirae bacterium GWF2_44_13]OGW63542.1 MAG: acetoin dehydrogenase [Nitrospirae bacterium RIFOXYA2_FULL_44_9]
MESDAKVITFGLGVDDPKCIFGTTAGLKEKFGSERVFDMPVSENALTGVAIGASLNGIRPVMSHQRLDFFLLGMDQLVNNASKWFYMFGGKRSVPITIRLILGRGWGQGPQHSQNLQAWFAHIPGLKVVMPVTPYDAKGLLLSSIFDDNPVIYLEHRWLHNLEGEVPEGDYRVPIGKAHVIKQGEDLTIVSLSYMTIEALHAVDVLERQGIHCELVDLRTVSPIDWETVFQSVKKTGRVLALDTATETLSIAGEVVAKVSMELFDALKSPPRRLALPDFPTPTSLALTEKYYRRAEDIVNIVGEMLGNNLNIKEILDSRKSFHDVPGDWFKGPF